MTCPSCNSPLEPTARFCGVCGYKVAPNRPPASASSGPVGGARAQAAHARQPAADGKARQVASAEPASKPVRHPQAQAAPQAAAQPAPQHAPQHLAAAVAAGARAPAKGRKPAADDIYINQVL